MTKVSLTVQSSLQQLGSHLPLGVRIWMDRWTAHGLTCFSLSFLFFTSTLETKHIENTENKLTAQVIGLLFPTPTKQVSPGCITNFCFLCPSSIGGNKYYATQICRLCVFVGKWQDAVCEHGNCSVLSRPLHKPREARRYDMTRGGGGEGFGREKVTAIKLHDTCKSGWCSRSLREEDLCESTSSNKHRNANLSATWHSISLSLALCYK